MDIKISDAERLILANQFRILSHLDKNDGEYWEQLSGQLRDGHEWLYKSYMNMNMSPVLADDDATFVVKVVGLYSVMKDSYAALEDKTGISDYEVTFPGFDGNDSYESTLLGFTEALRRDGRFKDTLSEGRSLNSHCTSVRGYRRLIATWEQMGEPHYPLTKTQIEELALIRKS